MWDLWDFIKRVKCDLQRQIDALSGGVVTADSVTTFTNKSGNISQWTNDADYVVGIVHAAVTASGDGVSTTINIPHGLGSTPTAPIVVAGNAAAAGITWVSADATNIIVHYTVAPATGTGSLTYNISYKK